MRNLWTITALLGLSCMLFTACSSDDDNEEKSTQPTADFAFKVASDLTVTFTNNSEDAKSYAWDFGDGSASTEESPSHKYATATTVTVKLTAINGSKTDVKEKSLNLSEEQSAANIDGVFDDWISIPGLSMPTDATDSYGITKAKVTSDKNYIYFYVEMLKGQVHQLTTYFRFKSTSPNKYNMDWGYANDFADAQVVFWDLGLAAYTPEMGDRELSKYSRTLTGWAGDMTATAVPEGSGLWEVSGIKDIAAKATFDGTQHDLVAVEISMRKALIPADLTPDNAFGIAFYLQNADWADAGWLPVKPSSYMFSYNQTTKALVLPQ